MAAKPKVSIICLSFNQADYIAQALDGFLMQQTDFPVEILIHDDASSDGTADMIRRYAAKHDNIRPVLRSENQFSKGTGAFIDEMFAMAKGRYIAFCEGDDYWTDPSKLQRQSDYLDAHPDHALCFHPVEVVFERAETPNYTFPDPEKSSRYTFRQLLMENYIQTNSVMYRKHGTVHIPGTVMPRDWYLHLYHAQFGKIGFIKRTMAAYRRHDDGVWAVQKDLAFWERYASPHLELYDVMFNMFGDKAENAEAITVPLMALFDTLQTTDVQFDTTLTVQMTARFPQLAERYMRGMKKLTTEQTSVIAADQEMIAHLKHAVELKENHIRNLEQELTGIRSSRLWKSVSHFTKAERAKRKR